MGTKNSKYNLWVKIISSFSTAIFLMSLYLPYHKVEYNYDTDYPVQHFENGMDMGAFVFLIFIIPIVILSFFKSTFFVKIALLISSSIHFLSVLLLYLIIIESNDVKIQLGFLLFLLTPLLSIVSSILKYKTPTHQTIKLNNNDLLDNF